jgi:hypothetical protein
MKRKFTNQSQKVCVRSVVVENAFGNISEFSRASSASFSRLLFDKDVQITVMMTQHHG